MKSKGNNKKNAEKRREEETVGQGQGNKEAAPGTHARLGSFNKGNELERGCVR